MARRANSRDLRQLDRLPLRDRIQRPRRILGDRLRRLRERLGGNVHVPNRDVREIRVRRRQFIPANQPLKAGVDAIRTRAVVRILQNHFRSGVSHLHRSRFHIESPRETNLVHLIS